MLLTGLWGTGYTCLLNLLRSHCEKFSPFLSSLCCLCLLVLSFCPLLSPSLVRPLAKWAWHPVSSQIPLVCLLAIWVYPGPVCFLFLPPAFPNTCIISIYWPGPLSPVLFLPALGFSSRLSLFPFISFNLSPNLSSSPHVSSFCLPCGLYLCVFSLPLSQCSLTLAWNIIITGEAF